MQGRSAQGKTGCCHSVFFTRTVEAQISSTSLEGKLSQAMTEPMLGPRGALVDSCRRLGCLGFSVTGGERATILLSMY